MLPTTTSVTLSGSGATLDLNLTSGTQTIAALSGVSGTTFNSGIGSLIVGSTANTEFDGSLLGTTGTISKHGTGTFTLGGSSTYSGPTTITTGTMILKSTAALASSSITVSSGATFNTSGSLNGTPALTDLGALIMGPGPTSGITVRKLGVFTIGNSIFQNATATVAALSNHVNRTVISATALNIAGTTNAWTGKLDLTNNDLDVQNGNLAQLTNQVAEGYNGSAGGLWNGAGITSSLAAANTTHLTALGVIQNSLDGTTTGAPLYGSTTSLGAFDGLNVSDTDVLVKYTYYGDANLDGKIDGSDYSRIDNGSPGGLTGWYNGDFNYDGVINGSDYTLIDNAFNTQGASLTGTAEIAKTTAQIAPNSTAVPEPSNLGLLGCAGLAALSRRRRRNGRR
jgi:autotransporter-associated beta strand protein